MQIFDSEPAGRFKRARILKAARDIVCFSRFLFALHVRLGRPYFTLYPTGPTSARLRESGERALTGGFISV